MTKWKKTVVRLERCGSKVGIYGVVKEDCRKAGKLWLKVGIADAVKEDCREVSVEGLGYR
jgi:hypothetical protein